MIKQHTKAMDEIKRELHQERLKSTKRSVPIAIGVPEFVQVIRIISNETYLVYMLFFFARLI